jgi:SAM-dependent methyltransferase
VSDTEGGNDRDESHLWANDRADEKQRLRLLEAVADPRSFRLLEQAGVGEGWRCAELGAGAGSVAGWLSERVGTTGRVLAVDLDTRFLAAVGSRPNVDVVEQDLAEVDLTGGAFDLIHTRNVLVHLPERDAILERLIAALRPGGVLNDIDHVLHLLEQESFWTPLMAVVCVSATRGS